MSVQFVLTTVTRMLPVQILMEVLHACAKMVIWEMECIVNHVNQILLVLLEIIVQVGTNLCILYRYSTYTYGDGKSLCKAFTTMGWLLYMPKCSCQL